MTGWTTGHCVARLRAAELRRRRRPRCRDCGDDAALDRHGLPYPRCYACGVERPRCLACGNDVALDRRGLPWPRCRPCTFGADDPASAHSRHTRPTQAAYGPPCGA